MIKKQYCKECNILKEFSKFYSHPKWKNWVLWRCKECIKKWRSSDRERSMARIIDNNRTRPEWYTYNATLLSRKRNPIWNRARAIVNNYFKYHKEDKPTECCICWSNSRIHLHHEDYSNPREVYPLCPLCHSARHKWEIELDIEDLITF